jgi:predicted nucleic acid-binding protein
LTLTAGPGAVVVDASVAVEVLAGNEAWLERWTGWAATDAMLLAPTQLHAEVANALLRGARLPATEVTTAMTRLAGALVETVDRGTDGLLEAIVLADRHGLTVYDALYLQLAIEVEAELATLDHALARAAEAEGVAVVKFVG